MTELVSLEIKDEIATITLNRPQSLNAFNERMAEDWAAVTSRAVNEAKAVLLAAEGRAFCAGGDVKAMSQMKERGSEIERLAGRINEGIRNLVESSIPVVAAAHGTTAGGGLGILLSSDYAVAGESSKIGSLYASIGLTPDLSVSALLARAVGERRALQLTLRETMLPAELALEWGLVAEVVADSDVLARARKIAEDWRDGASWAYGQAKRLIRSQPERTFVEQLAEEAKTIGMASETKDADQRIMSFSTK